MVRYVLSKTIVALTGKATVIEIPAGTVVKGPATIPRKGTVRVLWRREPLTVLVLDLLDSARIVPGEQE